MIGNHCLYSQWGDSLCPPRVHPIILHNVGFAEFAVLQCRAVGQGYNHRSAIRNGGHIVVDRAGTAKIAKSE